MLLEVQCQVTIGHQTVLLRDLLNEFSIKFKLASNNQRFLQQIEVQGLKTQVRTFETCL